jgi:hypothetical protein
MTCWKLRSRENVSVLFLCNARPRYRSLFACNNLYSNIYLFRFTVSENPDLPGAAPLHSPVSHMSASSSRAEPPAHVEEALAALHVEAGAASPVPVASSSGDGGGGGGASRQGEATPSPCSQETRDLEAELLACVTRFYAGEPGCSPLDIQVVRALLLELCVHVHGVMRGRCMWTINGNTILITTVFYKYSTGCLSFY